MSDNIFIVSGSHFAVSGSHFAELINYIINEEENVHDYRLLVLQDNAESGRRVKKNGRRRGGGGRRRSLAMATSSAMRLLGSAGTGFGQGWETRKIKTYVTATLCDGGNTAAAL